MEMMVLVMMLFSLIVSCYILKGLSLCVMLCFFLSRLVFLHRDCPDQSLIIPLHI